MPRGYRSILIALTGLSLVGAQPPKQSGQHPAPAASQKVDAPAPSPPLQKAEEPTQHNPPCAQGDDDRSSDLCAQWKAADAAKSSSLAAWVLGIVGTLIGGLTLAAASVAAYYAKKAAVETEKGATAALAAVEATGEANEIARETLVNQDRAWLVVDVRVVNSLRIEGAVPEQEIRGDFLLTVRNIGKSPARNLAIDIHLLASISLDLWTKQEGFAAELKAVPKSGWIPGGTIFPDSPYSQEWEVGTGPEGLNWLRKMVPNVEEGRSPMMLGVVGCVQYQLPGSERLHQTGFAFELLKISPAGRGLVIFENELPLGTDKIAIREPVGGYSHIT